MGRRGIARGPGGWLVPAAGGSADAGPGGSCLDGGARWCPSEPHRRGGGLAGAGDASLAATALVARRSWSEDDEVGLREGWLEGAREGGEDLPCEAELSGALLVGDLLSQKGSRGQPRVDGVIQPDPVGAGGEVGDPIRVGEGVGCRGEHEGIGSFATGEGVVARVSADPVAIAGPAAVEQVVGEATHQEAIEGVRERVDNDVIGGA